METDNTTIDRADATQTAAITFLLHEHQLTTYGIAENIGNYFTLRDANLAILAIAGFETYDNVALLRSVAVTEARRGQGMALKLCREIIKQLRKQGITSLYLLTETAAPFFSNRLKFMVTDRNQAPLGIRNCWEFSQHCPDSATLMKLDL